MGGERLDGEGELLDVGCGGGWLLAELRERGVAAPRLHGIDLIESRVSAARKRLPEADVRFDDAAELPYEDGRFALVTLLTSLSSMPRESVEPALREASRILAPGGAVLCYEPRIANPFNRATVTISAATLESVIGSPEQTRHLTGFPPLARRLGRLTPRFYPLLARVAPTHRLTAHEPGGAPRRRG